MLYFLFEFDEDEIELNAWRPICFSFSIVFNFLLRQENFRTLEYFYGFPVSFVLGYLSSQYPCSIVQVPSDYLVAGVAFMLTKNSTYTPIFNAQIQRLAEVGQIDRVQKKYQRIMECPSESFKRIKYETIFTAFILLGIGVLAAGVALSYERYKSRGGQTVEQRMVRFACALGMILVWFNC